MGNARVVMSEGVGATCVGIVDVEERGGVWAGEGDVDVERRVVEERLMDVDRPRRTGGGRSV